MKNDRKYREDPLFNWYPHRELIEHGLDPQKSLLGNLDKLKWGTYGKNREHKLLYKPMVSLTTEHLNNILLTETWISDETRWCVTTILEERYNPAPKELFEI